MYDYLVSEDSFLPVREIGERGLDALASQVRRDILSYCGEVERTVPDIVDELGLDRQTIYYHLEKLSDAGLVEERGSHPTYVTAPDAAFYFRPDYVEPMEQPMHFSNVPSILRGFVVSRRIRARIVVGAPFPHGEFDRRHRTAYKAGEIACLLGNYGRKSRQLVYTDEDVERLQGLAEHPIISVAGFRVNTFSGRINDAMPARFDQSGERIMTSKDVYTGEETGFVARAEIDGRLRMLVAGISGLGTSAAIEALYSRAKELGDRGAVVRGFGSKERVEEVTILERLEGETD